MKKKGRLSILSDALLAAAFAAGVFAGTSPVSAQSNYPDKPIRIIAPYAAGGGDYQPREMAKDLTVQLGQQVIVENRDGGGGTIGTTAAKNAAPDGYTLLWVGNSALTVAPHLRKLSYSYKDFDFLGNTARTPLTLVTRPGRPYKTYAELIDYARKNPDTVLMGSAGIGTSTHMLGEAIQSTTGVRFKHVPYRGLGAAIPALIGDSVDILIGLTGPMMPNIEAKNLIVLATTGAQRSSFLPDAPSFKELGVSLTEDTKYGWYVPKGTPADIRKKLENAIAATVKKPEFVKAMEKSYTGVTYLDPATAEKELIQESEAWAKLLKQPQFESLIEK